MKRDDEPPSAPAKRKKPGPKARAKARALREQADRIARGEQVAPMARPEPPPSPPPADLLALGPPPSDPLEANAWAHRATLLAMHSAAIDERISERERRKEIRTLGAAAAKLIPQVRLWEAEQMIREDRHELERKRQQREAKLVPRQEADAHRAKLELRPDADASR